MNEGQRYKLREEHLEGVRNLLGEVKELNGSLGGKFTLGDIYEPFLGDGKVRRFINNVDKSTNIELVIGRDYWLNGSCETTRCLGLKVDYTYRNSDQTSWYHCPINDTTKDLFRKHLELDFIS